MVHTCPRCELRFLTAAELTEHMARDHAVNTERFERNRYPADSRAADIDARPIDDGKRYLVVANQTALEPRLFNHLSGLAAAGPARFQIVAPAMPSHAATETGRGSIGPAEWRLKQLVDRLQAAGIDAVGELGDAEPYRAVRRIVERQPVDEIILSTFPAGMSRWLDTDLPTRLRHKLRLPVTVVNAADIDAMT